MVCLVAELIIIGSPIEAEAKVMQMAHNLVIFVGFNYGKYKCDVRCMMYDV